MIAALLLTPIISLQRAVAGKGGKGGGFVRLCVTFFDFDLAGSVTAITHDMGGSYCDKVEGVLAITGDGFRLDTADKANPPIRVLSFDFVDREVFPGVAGTHDPPMVALAPTDMRFHVEYYSDVDGNLTNASGIGVAVEEREVESGRMNPPEMEAEEIARAALTIPFRTHEDDGTERRWRVVYGDSPGSYPSMPYSQPVYVFAGPDNDGDDQPDDWLIEGSVAALFELVPGPKKNSLVPAFVGYYNLPVLMLLDRN